MTARIQYYTPNNEGFIIENIGKLCKTAIDPRKNVSFMCGAHGFAKYINFLHYRLGDIKTTMSEKEGARLLGA